MQQEQRTCLRIAVVTSLSVNVLSVLLLLPTHELKWLHIVPALFLSPSYLSLSLIWPWPAHDMSLLIISEVLALTMNVLPFYFFTQLAREVLREARHSQQHRPHNGA
jgi:hypothetical protein